MLYLGQPYSHPKSVIREVRYLAGMQACAHFHKENICVFAPIVHWHRVAVHHKLTTDMDTWRVQCIGMLKRATAFGMLLLDGWEESKGLREEWFEACQLDLPIDRYICHDGEVYWIGEGMPRWSSTP